MRADAERVVKARVTSATDLPAGELDAIKAALSKRFGREVEIESAVDASLIGGAVIDAGDVVIDGSLKGKLERLRAELGQESRDSGFGIRDLTRRGSFSPNTQSRIPNPETQIQTDPNTKTTRE